MNSPENTQRNYGIDLLRMTAMLMVAILHIMGHGGVLAAMPALSWRYAAAWALETAAYCAVNCYVLISGYVGIDSKFRYTNIAVLWLRTLFYTVVITAVCAVLLPGSVGRKEWLSAVFPVMRGQYWFFTAYFAMFFFIPLLNAAVNKLTRIQAKAFAAALIILFSILPTVFHYDAFGTAGGYSTLWFIVLYIIGACLKKHGVSGKITASKALAGYFISIALTWLVKLAFEAGTQRLFGAAMNGNLLVSYTSPTILCASICLLLFFGRLSIGGRARKIIGVLSPAAFGVYLIHEHPLVRTYFITGRFASCAALWAPLLAPAVLAAAFAVYAVCSALDLLRELLFQKLRVKQRISALERTYLKNIWDQ